MRGKRDFIAKYGCHGSKGKQIEYHSSKGVQIEVSRVVLALQVASLMPFAVNRTTLRQLGMPGHFHSMKYHPLFLKILAVLVRPNQIYF